MKTTIITTTIYVPHFLTGYEENTRLNGYTNTDFIVVGDLKSPSETAAFCETVPHCTYLDIDAQQEYMARFPALSEHLPFNSVERRNIGMLMAYERGADRIITVDDDNYATSHDVVGSHSIVGARLRLPTYWSSTGWFNVCSFLQEQNNVEFYHRGYPPSQRWHDGIISHRQSRNRVVVNAGFWLDNPDVDAITRMERELVVVGYKSGWTGTIALAPGTWSPFDCQNTALLREVIPAYFLSPYVGRHSDIFAAYIVDKLAEHFGDVVAFGNPLALHKRTPHDLWKDLDVERDAMRMTDDFCRFLRTIDISADSYHEGYGQIVKALRSWACTDMEKNLVVGMSLWHEVFETLRDKS